MIFDRLFKRPKLKKAAQALYLATVRQARAPIFYSEHRVPDTVDGRFDMIVMHVWLVLKHLRSAPEALQAQRDKLAQAIFDEMIRDFDRNVREIGISDVRVGKHMKAMAKAFYGRIAAYDTALEEGAMTEAVKRNVYGTADISDEFLDPAAQYVSEYIEIQRDFLASQSFEAILDGKMTFSSKNGEESR